MVVLFDRMMKLNLVSYWQNKKQQEKILNDVRVSLFYGLKVQF